MAYLPSSDILLNYLKQKVATLNATKQQLNIVPQETTVERQQPISPTAPSYLPVQPPTTPVREFSPTTPTQPIQASPTRAELEQKEYEWWEKPAEATQTLMQKFGEGASKVPLVGEALELAAPVLEWVHENIEKNWAAGLTAPFSPSLAPKAGEDWFAREKREYEAWEAPTYIKGTAEFFMPLWWIPWVGWIGKGAKSLGIASKAAKILPTTAGKAVVATLEEFNKWVKPSMLRQAAWKVENIPVLGKLAKTGLGEQIFRKTDTMTKTIVDKSRDAILYEKYVNATLGDMTRILMNRPLAYLEKHGSIRPDKLLQLRDSAEGFVVDAVTTNAAKAGVRTAAGKVSYLVDDVISNPNLYVWKDKVAKGFIDEVLNVADYFEGMAKANGIQLPKRVGSAMEYLPRIVKEIERGGEKFALHGKTDPFKQLVYDTAKEGAEAGVRYSDDVLARLNLFGEAVAKRVSTSKFDDIVKDLSLRETGKRSVREYIAANYPDQFSKYSALKDTADILEDIGKRMSIASGVRAPKLLHGSQLNKLRAIGFNELADRIAAVQVLPTKAVSQIVRSLSKKRNIKPLKSGIIKDYIYNFGETMTRKEAVEALTKLIGKSDVAENIIDQLYRDTLNFGVVERAGRGIVDVKITSNVAKMRRLNNEALKSLRQEVDDLARANVDELAEPKAWYKGAVETAKTAHAGEAIFRTHSAFGKRIFPEEVVRFLQPKLEDAGIEWMRGVQKASGASRMLIASLDLSAGLIQGINLFGLNAVIWGKTMGKMFNVGRRPQNLYKELATREATRMDRVMHGGSTAAMDYFDAMPLVRKAVGKFFGKKGERVVSETYGRAEAAFLGFGEIARDEMWKVGRSMFKDPDKLRDWARSIDRMTGVISPEKMGLGRTQQQIENTWVFFAPRYTRAGFAFMGDLMKGGMTGKVARDAISGYMLGGFTMYAGVMAALGQEPNFDPNSAKFMTAKIGNHRVGLGGFTYGFMRMLAGVTQSAIEDPGSLSPLNLSRTDNPFYKFMFNRTSPLTSTVAGFMEQENFLGEPFESPADWAKFMAEKVTPIALQSVLGDEGFHPAVLGAELLGGRTYPKSTWEVRDEYRERGSKELYGKEWGDLTRAEQREIESESEILMELDQEIKDKNIIRGDPEQIERNRWLDEVEDAKAERDSFINIASEMAITDGDYYKFRERIADIDNDYAAVLGHISENYKTIIDGLNEPNLQDMNYLDATYNIWTQKRYASDMENALGEPEWDKVEKLRTDFEKEYGREALEYAEQDRVLAGRDLPEVYMELRKAKAALRPYWKIRSDYEGLFGKPSNNTYQQRLMDKVVGSQQKAMLAGNPEMAKFYAMFYKRT